jgi:hypothetical protein
LAFLKAFGAWEGFLEDSFLRYLCGYSHSGGRQVLNAPHSFATTLPNAEAILLGGRSFLLWHNPRDVVSRSHTYFTNGRHEIVLNSVLSRVASFAAVRHHIAHQKRDTAAQFDSACVNLCGHQLSGSRPGRFLRKNVVHAMPPKKWFELMLTDLEGYAAQITP